MDIDNAETQSALDVSSHQVASELDQIASGAQSLQISHPGNGNDDANVMPTRSASVFRNNVDLPQNYSRFTPQDNYNFDFDNDDADVPSNLTDMFLRRLKTIRETSRELSEPDKPTITQLTLQLDRVEKYYSRVLAHIEKNNALGMTPLQALESERVISEADDLYDGLKCELVTKIDSMKSALQPPQAATHRYQDHPCTQKIIVSFAGDHGKWPNFKSEFEQLVHKNTVMTGLRKFLKLDSVIVPDSEPFETISGYDRTDETYLSAWNDLCTRYDNPRKIVESTIMKFIDTGQQNAITC